MKTNLLQQDFEISVKRMSANQSPPHHHRYFELIYVIKGNGKHLINGNNFPYAEGDLFLLHPEDLHTFDVDAPTDLCIIDLTGGFYRFIGSAGKSEYPVLPIFERLEFVFHNHARVKGAILPDESDRSWMQTLMHRLLWEKEQQRDPAGITRINIVFLLLELVARYIREQSVFLLRTERAERLVRDIINYIHEHIYHREATRIERVARQFHKSKDHISLYFKKHTGLTLKEYITDYKMELVKTRLLYSDLTIAAVAAELDFTDESHLNKVFRMKFGMTARAFRNQGREK